MSQPNTLKPLRPAASLILTFGTQGIQAHQYLTIVRKPHLSFANSVVFPGGVCEPIDDQHLKSQHFQTFAKITAVRQTAEETGVLILPPSVKFQRLSQFKAMYKNRQQKGIAQYLSQIWVKHVDLIKPILRLATPQLKKTSRFDCIFYILDKSVQKINIGSSDDLTKLDIATDESKDFFWKQPNEYLNMFTEGTLQLPPPQIIIFNILRNLQQKGMTLDTLFQDKQLAVEPMMFQFDSKLNIVIHGDSSYKLELLEIQQPPSPNASLIKQFILSHPKPPKDTRRRIKQEQSEKGPQGYFQYTGNRPEPTLFKYMPQHKSSL